MARPTKFSSEVQDAIIKALSLGATYKDAAEAAGISYDTFNEWMKVGRSAKSGKFYQFFKSVRRAEAMARLKYLSVIAEAAQNGDWRAALEFLKRRDRTNWGDNVDVTSGGERVPVRIIEIVGVGKEE